MLIAAITILSVIGLLVVLAIGACKVAGQADKRIEEIIKNKEDGKEKRKG